MEDTPGIEEYLMNILWYLSQCSVTMCWAAEVFTVWLVEYVNVQITLWKT